MTKSVCVLNLKRFVLVCAVLLTCNAAVFAQCQWSLVGNDIQNVNSGYVKIPSAGLTVGTTDTVSGCNLVVKDKSAWKPADSSGQTFYIQAYNYPDKLYSCLQLGKDSNTGIRICDNNTVGVYSELNCTSKLRVDDDARFLDQVAIGTPDTIPGCSLVVNDKSAWKPADSLGQTFYIQAYKFDNVSCLWLGKDINSCLRIYDNDTMSAYGSFNVSNMLTVTNDARFQDQVVIGGTSPDGTNKLTVLGNSKFTGDLVLGNVGTGPVSGYKLTVDGKVTCEELKVQMIPADYVFEPDYPLMPLAKLESYVTQQKHLPGIAPAAEVEKNGMEVSHMQTKLLEKVEELTLYVIQLKKENDQLKTRIEALETSRK
jgi:hypothetical protein